MVGRDAERRARLDPTRFEPNPKRRIDEQTLLLGTDVVPVTDALAAILRRVLEETSRQLGGEQPDEVRLTHPAQWGQTRRNVLMSAARLAGDGPAHPAGARTRRRGRALRVVPRQVARARARRSPSTTSARAPSTSPSSAPRRTASPCSPRTACPTSAASTSTRR